MHTKKARTNDPRRRSKLAPSKSGYTNDGGFVFNLAIIVTGLWVPLGLHMLSPKILVLDFILLLYGFLGFLTIPLSYGKKQNEGLKPWQKIIGANNRGLDLFSRLSP